MRLAYVAAPGHATVGAGLSAGAWQGPSRGLFAYRLSFLTSLPGAVSLSIPNLITLARILLVPVVVWAIASHQMLFAFLLFAAAGVSDAVDGFLAKRFGMASDLGR